MEIVLGAGIIECIFLILLLWNKKEKKRHDRFLSYYLIIIGFTLLLSFVEIVNRKNHFPFPLFINLSTPLILLHGPALWAYIRSLTSDKKLKIVHLLHCIPFIIVFLVLFFESYIKPSDLKIEAEMSESFKNSWLYPFIVFSIAISSQSYFIWGVFRVKQHRKNLRNQLADTSQLDLEWLRLLLLSAIISYILINGLYILDYNLQILSYNHLQITGFSIAAAYIFFLGYYGVKQGEIFSSGRIFQPTNFEIEIDDKANKGVQDFSEEITLLLNFMNEQKPYLDPSINLRSLSQSVNMPIEHLSRMLNNQLNSNFFDFINHYRVNEYKARLKSADLKKQTLISIAWDCGFNSKATFHRQFKLITGLTPSEYLNKVSKQ